MSRVARGPEVRRSGPRAGARDRRTPRLMGVMAVLAGLAVAACGGAAQTAATPAPTATAAPPATAAAGQSDGPSSSGGSAVSVFVDLVTCDNVGGSGSASGTIENMAGEATAYRIRIAFMDGDGAQVAEGSGDTAEAAAGAAVDWSVSVTGLGGAEVSCRTLDVTAIAGSGPPAATLIAGEFPCTLVDRAVVAQLAGNPVEPGDASTVYHDQDGITWTAAECAWLSFEQDPVGVSLEVTTADGFPSGTLGCPPLPGATGPAEGLGAPAMWAWTDPGTLTTVGTLRVCDPAALVDVRVDGPGGETVLRAVAVGVATAALAAE